MQDIWLNSVGTIYQHLARRSIPCERHARQVLALQGGPSPESRITSVKEVVQLLKNRNVVERAIHMFKHQIRMNYNLREEDPREYGPIVRPPYLTRIERSRFIRSYYQLWALMKIGEPAEWLARLESMTIKQLLHLMGIARYNGLKNDSQSISPPHRENFDIISPYSLEDPRSRLELWQWSGLVIQKRLDRYGAVDLQSEDLILQVKNTKLIRQYAFDNEYDNFLIISDGYQQIIKKTVRSTRVWKPSSEKGWDWELWEDSSDEDNSDEDTSAGDNTAGDITAGDNTAGDN